MSVKNEKNKINELRKSEFTPSTTAQLGILVLDGSGSMMFPGKTGKPKGEEVKEAARGFTRRLQKSKFEKDFYVAFVAFDTKVIDVWNGYRKVSEVKLDEIVNPVYLVGGDCTNITLALQKAKEIADRFMVDNSINAKERVVVIILLSDGIHNTGEPPFKIANEINSKYTLATVAYGKDADTALLKDIAKSKEYYTETDDPKELRNFFIRSSFLIRMEGVRVE